MNQTRSRKIIYILLGIALGFAIVFVAETVIHRSRSSGCPVKYDYSTVDAQVFLMGTVGGVWQDPSRDCWREHVVQPVLDELGVTYFNPVVKEWSGEDADREARALANAEVIVLVITDTSPSFASLSESGWALLGAMQRNQKLIMYIDPQHSDEDSERARLVVLSQARRLAAQFDGLIMVNSLDEVLEALRALYVQS